MVWLCPESLLLAHLQFHEPSGPPTDDSGNWNPDSHFWSKQHNVYELMGKGNWYLVDWFNYFDDLPTFTAFHFCLVRNVVPCYLGHLVTSGTAHRNGECKTLPESPLKTWKKASTSCTKGEICLKNSPFEWWPRGGMPLLKTAGEKSVSHEIKEYNI